MNKISFLFTIVVTILLTVSCVTLHKSKSVRVKPGMTKNQVVAIMGNPGDIQANGNSTAWQYFDMGVVQDEYTVVWFLDDKVTGTTYYEKVGQPHNQFNPIVWEQAPHSKSIGSVSTSESSYNNGEVLVEDLDKTFDFKSVKKIFLDGDKIERRIVEKVLKALNYELIDDESKADVIIRTNVDHSKGLFTQKQDLNKMLNVYILFITADRHSDRVVNFRAYFNEDDLKIYLDSEDDSVKTELRQKYIKRAARKMADMLQNS